MIVLVFPPNESCSNRVSFESLYGMCFDLPSTRAEITFPSAESDRLIFVASFSRSPVAPVFACRSELKTRKKTWIFNGKNNMNLKKLLKYLSQPNRRDLICLFWSLQCHHFHSSIHSMWLSVQDLWQKSNAIGSCQHSSVLRQPCDFSCQLPTTVHTLLHCARRVWINFEQQHLRSVALSIPTYSMEWSDSAGRECFHCIFPNSSLAEDIVHPTWRTSLQKYGQMNAK